MKKSFLFLLLSYTLTQPSPRGRGRLPEILAHSISCRESHLLLSDYFLQKRFVGIELNRGRVGIETHLSGG